MLTDERTWAKTLTTNGIPPLIIDRETWLRITKQTGKRHPTGPDGRCMTCGVRKLGWWEWRSADPD